MEGFAIILFTVLNYTILLLQLILFAYMILSWMHVARQMSRSTPYIDPGNPIVRFIEDIANMILSPIRRVMSKYQGNFPLDLSFLVAVLGLDLIRRAVLPQILYFGGVL